MRLIFPVLWLAWATACGSGERGPGITGDYFVRFEAVNGDAIEADNVANLGQLLWSAGSGRWVVDFGDDGVHLYDSVAGTSLFAFTELPVSQVGEGFVHQPTRAGPLSYTEDGSTWTEVPLPEDVQITEVIADPFGGAVYVAGVSTAPTPSPMGSVLRSEDLGQTWQSVAGGLMPAQGTLASVTFGSAIGYPDVLACPADGVFVGPVCRRYRVIGDTVAQMADGNQPNAVGLDADGRVVGRARRDRGGRVGMDLVLYDVDQATQDGAWLDHFHTPFAVSPAFDHIDVDGVMWVTGWGIGQWSWWRTTEPLGRAHDQRSEVLQGHRCARYFTDDMDGGYDGDPIDMPITNTLDEPLYVVSVRNYTPEVPYEFGMDDVRIEAGETRTFTPNDEHWYMAMTEDGRCMGYGMAKQLAGRSLP
ncbi:MAG: hypothetical protein EP330_15600 [Deltaproteobacteria bacterium]|nr:MAG: hypothetical protein EP330_15600 [Deltaproteobacteria bacterium]